MRTFLLTLIFVVAAGAARAASQGDEVVVVYNSRLPESKQVADYYAARRNVPTNQVFGFPLATNEDISRTEFEESLQKPLAKALEQRKLWHIGSEIIAPTNDLPGRVVWRVQESRIRYAVLCYGVPLRIGDGPNLTGESVDKIKPELRRNGAAVDNELALLPGIEQKVPLMGPLGNSHFTTTNAASLNPTNGILMVTRLDGPSAAIARGLVDKALEAEASGLCGRAYFDLRNLPTNSPYRMGDEWIMGAAAVCDRLGGFETVVDTNGATFPADFPMSQIAIYCGWYDEHASGPFAQKNVEFMPGAFAYHLHSFSAATIRSTTLRWVGPMLAKGAAASMGSVDEPYLTGTPDVAVFCARWILQGFNFGEAAYASQATLSWQTTVVGDPLYAPFKKPLPQLIADQERAQSKSIEWSYLRAVNMSLAAGKRPMDVTSFLAQLPATAKSAILTEKLADLYAAQGRPSSAIETYQKALVLGTSPLQAVRIRLELADKMVGENRVKEAVADLEELLDSNPDYPGRDMVSRKLRGLTAATPADGPSAKK